MNDKPPKRPAEKDLLKGLNHYSAHGDELADLDEAEWPDKFGDFSPEYREQSTHHERRPLERLRGSIKKYDDPTKPVWPDDEA